MNLLGDSIEMKTASNCVIVGGGILAAFNCVLLSIPLNKFNKEYIKQSPHKHVVKEQKLRFSQKFLQSDPYIVDPSPFLTLIACVSGFLIYSIFLIWDTITTIMGKIIMGFMGFLLIGIFLFIYRLLPSMVLKEVKKRALKMNNEFNTSKS